MTYLVRIHDTTTNRVWFEIRESDDELMALAETVFENHPKGNHVVTAIELDTAQDAVLPWAPIERALGIAIRYGQIDGDHHKTWVIDQIVRALTGDKYEQTIREANAGEDGPDTYSWDVGIAP